MYGLVLENLAEYIKQVYGEDRWEEIRRLAAVEQPSFSVHQVYPENLIPRLAKKAIQVPNIHQVEIPVIDQNLEYETSFKVLNVSEREFFDQMGVHFVGFVGQYGYDRVLSVLGRHMRDFLNGLDNLHEYLKFSYPRMRAPSFICENETRQGLTLHYRSKRRGFVYYTMGQIREVRWVQAWSPVSIVNCRAVTVEKHFLFPFQVARHFYHKEMRIELVREEILFDTVHVTFQLTFDNRAFTLASLTMTREEKHLPISASVLFEIFPFCIVFGWVKRGHLFNFLPGKSNWCDDWAFSLTKGYKFSSDSRISYISISKWMFGENGRPIWRMVLLTLLQVRHDSPQYR